MHLCVPQIQGSIHPHAIIILPNSAGTEVLVCYEDEGVYIDTYGRITKDTVLQWGEMPASVGKSDSSSDIWGSADSVWVHVDHRSIFQREEYV